MQRALTGHSGEIFGQHAQIVLRIGIADTIADAFPVLGGDVRNAISRARDARFEALRLRVGLTGKQTSQDDQGC